ncbi:MAG: hypothetical protein QM737_09850 [Ferruginibacter sp.]
MAETNRNQTENTVNNGDVVGGDKITTYHTPKKTKLNSLFEKLKAAFDGDNRVTEISEDLQRFFIKRDVIGLEQKLKDGNLEHLLDDAAWLKQEYYKKLTKFQFFEPAQQIHAFILGIVLEKFRNIIAPMIRNGNTEIEISRTISTDVIDPIMLIIREEGCDDIMGLSATDIEGMIFYLTGQCHIKWVKNDSLSPSV